MTEDAVRARQGVFFALAAYSFWGFAPIYFKSVQQVPAFEILAHRIIWAFILVFILIVGLKRLNRLKPIIRSPKMMFRLTVATCLLGGNWFLFIWAVNANHMLDASLGYYINPLLNVAIGMAFFQEKMRRLQLFAIGLAIVGVGIQVVTFGSVPWVALALASSFAIYGAIRKRLPVDSISGLWLETTLLVPVMLGYLLFFADSPSADMTANSWQLNVLLMAAGLVTTIPLLCFTAAAQRIRYATLGFFQYIAPSLMFILAVNLYDEPLAESKLITFVIIWSALALYTFDSVIQRQRNRRLKKSAVQEPIS
ncbi:MULTISPECIES: EamA family transporter RarD [Idiomarina]|jgi:chloramphenicol-sensitive protein RarD|uniref:Conserved membrane protein RarD n=2 Tax=Idiomarina baltica TaxID=190892 RepID=A0ABP2CS39_9GAMM|nr:MULTISPECIES: EamA family transporter RarD [Idiomarina]MAF75027.1 protein RarD [Idiomarinaceae bacterium]MEC8924585.1 EamA family transporter RarD [Pseudomonadota bacterium]EAQ32668.1 Conserved membrane protein RarD [Idiomarina baltica OS145]KXS34314.1 MAG: membrane protein RarD [Idiomarina sp. T82-3]MBR38331.1 EamA family transporter RarD [Idiomarina sp.]|tara:strand:+ start:5510 stop:6439 length:930 start_codon:yes stop_codon:yes gene_type:complete